MYGVLLWEILTFAREQPFENLTDEKVIENIGHIYQDSKKHVSYLQSTKHTSRSCWRRQTINKTIPENICELLNFNDRFDPRRYLIKSLRFRSLIVKTLNHLS